MDEKQLLCSFEERYPFLYDIQVKGVPLYTCFRDDVLRLLREGAKIDVLSGAGEKGRIYPRRIVDTFVKLTQNRKRRSLIFTSSVYRRDHGRNLAAEYLLERYPDAIVFEWPSRNESFDSAYFTDPQKARYCPLDGYVLLQKVYGLLRKKKAAQIEREVRDRLVRSFQAAQQPRNENEQAAIDAIIEKLPKSCAQTELRHDIFRWLFKGYTNVDTAVDFWGSARENIIPVLPGKVQSVELQHGLINHFHPGYVYPQFVGKRDSPFFRRKLLVYGEGTKKILCEESVFRPENVEAIGNPRIQGYKRLQATTKQDRNLILFASQTYEVDGTGTHYYDTVIPVLQRISQILKSPEWEGYRLGIKLHPREHSAAVQRYKSEVPDAIVFDATSQLYDLLSQTYLQLTVSSTTLFEAAEFNAPTVAVQYNNIVPKDMFGFDVWIIKSDADCERIMQRMRSKADYNEYLEYIQENARMSL